MLGISPWGVDIWILAIVPLLAIVAVIDSVVGLSKSVSSRLGFGNSLMVHVAILIFTLSTSVFLLSHSFNLQLAFGTTDYVNSRDHAFEIENVPRLIFLDALLMLSGAIAAVIVSIWRKQNILLTILACILGNIGTIVWVVHNGKPLSRAGYS
jgi:hypothetical protein